MKLFTDDPIQVVTDDKLQRSIFANQVAEVCRRVHIQGESSVMALISPWGSGKSSLLNLVKESLADDEEWLVGEYNPWLLSDIESLVREFFVELRSILPEEYQKGKLKDVIKSYANAVSPIASALGLVGVNVPDQLKELAQDLLRGDTSLSKRKIELEDALRDAGRPILLILDDLDRLEPDELMMVFKLVRLVGRLPNVYYLLSYDENTLLDVITQTELARGNRKRAHDYLEKIVQLRLDMPPLHERQQLKLLNSAFDEVAERNTVAISDDDQELLNDAYTNVLKHYLDEPRAINRYFAQIDALYSLVGGEVNFADFSLITFLRTEFPEVYKLVQKHKDELVNKTSLDLSFRDAEKLGDREVRWMNYLKESGCNESAKIIHLLALMFLPIKSAIQGSNYGDNFYEDLRLQKRIGSQDYFDRYFQFGVPEGDISDTEIANHVKRLTQNNKAQQKLAKKWLKAKLLEDPSLFLRKLRADMSQLDYPTGALLQLLGSGYNSMPERSGTLGFDPKWDVVRIARRLFVLMSEEERQTVSSSMASTAPGLSMLADLLETSMSSKEITDQDIIADNKKILTIDDLVRNALREHFDKLALKKLEQAQDSDRILLYRLMSIDSDRVREFMWSFLEKSRWPLIDFVAWFVPTTRIWGGSKPKYGLGDLSMATIDQMFGVDILLEKLKGELDKSPESYDKDEEPTLANRKNYALSVLKQIRDNGNNEP